MGTSSWRQVGRRASPSLRATAMHPWSGPALPARIGLLLSLAALLSACATGAQTPRRETVDTPPAPKSQTLRIGIVGDAEPKEGLPYGRGAGGLEPVFMLH